MMRKTKKKKIKKISMTQEEVSSMIIVLNIKMVNTEELIEEIIIQINLEHQMIYLTLMMNINSKDRDK